MADRGSLPTFAYLCLDTRRVNGTKSAPVSYPGYGKTTSCCRTPRLQTCLSPGPILFYPVPALSRPWP